MNSKIKIVIVEHDSNDLELIQYELNKGEVEYEAVVVQTEEDYRRAITMFHPDLILSDYSLPSFNGSTAFLLKQQLAPDIPFIFVSGTIGEEASIEYIKSGVTDYVLKDKLFSLATKVKRALKEAEEKRQKHKIAQAQIQSERRLARAQQVAHMGSWELNASTNILQLSDEACRIFGMPLDQNQLPFATWSSLIHPEDLDWIILAIQEDRFTLNDTSYHYRIVRKDGTVRHVYSESKHELDVNGQPIGSYGIIHDVTEIKLAEQQTKFDKNNLKALINNTRDLMWSIDRDFKLITSNLPFDEMVKSIAGKPIAKGEDGLSVGFSAEQTNRYKHYYERAFAGETFTETEHTILPIETWSEISFSPIHIGEEVVGAACHSHDITERKRAEIQLKEQNQELIKVNTELDRFVYSASHELRAPLSSVLGLIYLFGVELKETSQLKQLNLMEISIKKLDGFIQDIVHYSRNSRMECERDLIDFKELVSDSIEQLRYMELANRTAITVDITQEIDFYSDRKRIRIILNNLLSNAIKYQNTGLENQAINIRVQTDNEQVVIEIIDNGIGISPEYHDNIFEMFFRLPSPIAGSGIGLYIVKEIIDRLEGTIEVESKPRVGTTFTVKIKNTLPSHP